ncbi:acetyl-CoA C-acyltransferase [Phycicoccus sp. DTK01]|uniref:thiolase family protein n=1 Tax=Phycicoccus sp. DTK01 TaxID=2785745 RepID=UPI001A8D57FD|nr:acetyl-CoA C-acyltransferase [Phycicoccus sp. DTK01]GIL36721.1 acetyl-CoA acetyltransferase [Phycicoccus sp. DTK01]
MSAPDPVLLDGLRTPFGRYRRALSTVASVDLAAHVVRALLERHPFLARPDATLHAQVLQGGQGQNPGRQAADRGGVDRCSPAVTLNNVCLGGVSAVWDACRRVTLGEGDTYLVGGADSMSRAVHAGLVRQGPSMASATLVDTLSTDGLWCALDDLSMGVLSDRVNAELGIGRDVQDHLAALSHERARAARDEGRLAEEIVALEAAGRVVEHDEGIRDATTPESLAALAPAFDPAGTITAGNASQMTDGASYGAVVSADVAEREGVRPLARIRGYAEVAGPDASLHLKPAVAVARVLERAGLTVADVDLLEINEAFAGVVEASRRELSVPMDVVNVNGGAIALGHPLGGTGFRLVLTAARELRRRGGRYAVASLCGGGGQGAALLLEAA